MIKITKPDRSIYGEPVVVTVHDRDFYHFQPREVKIYDIIREGRDGQAKQKDRNRQEELEVELIKFMGANHQAMVSPGNMGLAFLINNLVIEPAEISLSGWDCDKEFGGIHLVRRRFVHNEGLHEEHEHIDQYELPILGHETAAMQSYVQSLSSDNAFRTWLNNTFKGSIRVGYFTKG